MSRLGLVTVLYNGVDVLDGFFQSLAAQTLQDWLLVVVDNSPDERPLVRARELAASLKIENVEFFRNDSNVGVARANNQGIKICLERGCDQVILLNNDIEFSSRLISEVADILCSGANIVAPRILFHDSGRIWFGGGRINLFSGVAHHIGEGDHDRDYYARVAQTSYAPTCFLALNAEVFQKVGLMDERYFVYYDDTDFIKRCRNSGFKVLYLGSSVLSHKVSSSTGGGNSTFGIFYYNRNRLLFIRKHCPTILVPLSILWYFLTRAFVYLRYNKEEREVLASAVRQGLRFFFTRSSSTLSR